jgi:hypothetical protein
MLGARIDLLKIATVALMAFAAVSPAAAQDAEPERMPFAGGELIITQNEDLEKVLTFDGRELARNYVLYYDRTVEVDGLQVALFGSGDGGNACGTSTVIVWKPIDGEVLGDLVGEDCGAPPAAVTEDRIYFVPRPGRSRSRRSPAPTGSTSIQSSSTTSLMPSTTRRSTGLASRCSATR